MKFYYLSIIILLTVSCSNELEEKPHAGGTPIGIGEITSIPTAPAITDAYYRCDGERRYSLPISGTPYERRF